MKSTDVSSDMMKSANFGVGMASDGSVSKASESLVGFTKKQVKVGNSANAIRFETIRSFKGLEADVVFLIGICEGEHCARPDVYVGGSRARFLLYVFYKEDCWLVD